MNHHHFVTARILIWIVEQKHKINNHQLKEYVTTHSVVVENFNLKYNK